MSEVINIYDLRAPWNAAYVRWQLQHYPYFTHFEASGSDQHPEVAPLDGDASGLGAGP